MKQDNIGHLLKPTKEQKQSPQYLLLEVLKISMMYMEVKIA